MNSFLEKEGVEEERRALERRREGLQVEGEQENQSVSKGAKKGAGGCADSAAAFLANTYVLAEHDGEEAGEKRGGGEEGVS